MRILSLNFPFNSALSENNRLGYSGRSGRMYAKNEYKQVQEELSYKIKSQMKTLCVGAFDPRKRVFVTLTVHRPNNSSDASNFIKSINDAISRSIGVNDNLFDGSYSGLIDKKNPRFEIEIRQ